MDLTNKASTVCPFSDVPLTDAQSGPLAGLRAAPPFESQSIGGAFASGFANTGRVREVQKPWGSYGLSNGRPSASATRDTPGSRDVDHQPPTSQVAVTEAKKGSGSLLDSSVSDDWKLKGAWGTERNLPSRSVSQAKYPDASAPQQRATSNSFLPQTSVPQRPQPFVTQPPAFDSNTVSGAQWRPNEQWPNAFVPKENGHPPKVFTKFNRNVEQNARRFPDSAKSGSWSESSPTPPSTMSNGSALCSSRDISLPPSRNGTEQSFSMRQDFSSTITRTTQSSRTPSVSSQALSPFNSYMFPDFNQLPYLFNNFAVSGSGRPHRPSVNSQNFNVGTSTAAAQPYSQFQMNAFNASVGTEGDMSEVDYGDMTPFGFDRQLSPRQASFYSDYMNSPFPARFSQTPATNEFRPAQPYSNEKQAVRAYRNPTPPRMGPHWHNVTNGTMNSNGTSSISPNQYEQARFEPRISQTQTFHPIQSPCGPAFGSYPFPSNAQLTTPSVYGQMMPIGLDMFDPAQIGQSSAPGGDVQSLLLHEFRSSKQTRKYELKDIYKHVAEFSGDQHGSRFIQTKLESANSDEKEQVFLEIFPNAIPLMQDVFGNYVIQKFFEHGDQKHKRQLANQMKGQVLNLSLQMYGCRVVQKALDHVLVNQQEELIAELKDHVMRCVKDQNGNHVIQKAIERCPAHTIGFIIQAFKGQVQHLSTHPYGCRVIQRCLERFDTPSTKMIMVELVEGIHTMIADQFGNYVVQHVVAHDEGEAKRRVLHLIGNNLEAYSKHKFASNVVEKCLEMSDDAWRRDVVVTLAQGEQRSSDGEGVLVGLIKDSFGNYVIQKLLDTLCSEDYGYFHEFLQPAMTQAKRSGCGKQALSIEKKMHKQFSNSRQRSATLAQYNPGLYRVALPIPPFGSSFNSAATTPPPLTADTQSLQSSAIPSVNGDAVEGANFIRKGSEVSNDSGYLR